MQSAPVPGVASRCNEPIALAPQEYLHSNAGGDVERSWRISEEWLLYEAERIVLKLINRFDSGLVTSLVPMTDQTKQTVRHHLIQTVLRLQVS